MARYQVGSYHGPVTVLTQDNVEVAQAACRSTAERDYDGTYTWGGQLHQLSPYGVVGAGVYRLRFPTGEVGEVTFQAPLSDSDFVYFEGLGMHPLVPSTHRA